MVDNLDSLTIICVKHRNKSEYKEYLNSKLDTGDIPYRFIWKATSEKHYQECDYDALYVFIRHSYFYYFKYKGPREYYNYYEYLCLDRAPEENAWFVYLNDHIALIQQMDIGYKRDSNRDWGLLSFKVIVEAIKKSSYFEIILKDFITPIYERFSKYLPLPKDNELLLSDYRKLYLIEAYFDNEINNLNEIYRRFINEREDFIKKTKDNSSKKSPR